MQHWQCCRKNEITRDFTRANRTEKAFKIRKLTEEPIFVRKWHKQGVSDVVTTFEKEKCLNIWL